MAYHRSSFDTSVVVACASCRNKFCGVYQPGLSAWTNMDDWRSSTWICPDCFAIFSVMKKFETIHELINLRCIGKTSQGAVVAAELPNGEAIAIKLASANRSGRSPSSDDLPKEANMLKYINQLPDKPPQIVEIHEIEEQDGTKGSFWNETAPNGIVVHCVMMELVEGEDLFEVAKKFWTGKTEKYSEWLPQVQNWFRQIVSCLDFLHANNITHNDPTAENFILQPNGQIKAIDFGRAELFESGNFRIHGTKGGKLRNTAPEVWEGNGYNTASADIFGAGTILLGLLACGFGTNREVLDYVLEFKVEALLEKWNIKKQVPPEAVDLLGKMLVREEERISMSELKTHPYVTGNRDSIDVADFEDGKFMQAEDMNFDGYLHAT